MVADDISSLDSEAGVIATLIHHPEYIYFSEMLLPGHFTNKDNQYIYVAIQKLVNADIKMIDPYNIIEILESEESTRKYADSLSVEKLQELVEMSSILMRQSVDEYKILVSNIMEAAFRREMFQKLKECQVLCYDRSQEDIRQRIYGTIDDVMTAYSNADDVPLFGEVADELWAEIEAHQDGREAGIPFKIPSLNDYVRIEQGELVVVAAPAKGAKSMFMLNEAVDVLKQGKSVMYIDSELSSRLFMCRLISLLTGIEFARVRCGNYTHEEAAMIREQIEWVKQQPLVHIYMPIFNTQTIYASVQKVFHRFDGLDVLIVDYLKPSGTNSEAYNVYSELGNLTDLINYSQLAS